MLLQSLEIKYPAFLPVSQHKDEILSAIASNQVIIVCGETGSGKTTQLPKMLLDWLQQTSNSSLANRKPKLIGHTQPRRIAASSVAKRIAQELNTVLGQLVGYKVRFQDKMQATARIKLMTDGILLAETQTDPLLNAYQAIIIDEAHERSLNIDFLLGYLKQILPQRPDLKLIITSATIDAHSFAQHFSYSGQKVPVFSVSGRLYPVENRYQPLLETKDYGINNAIADAVEQLWQTNSQDGDILVFLPGENEIREASEFLQQYFSNDLLRKNSQIIPLFARLSQAEQEKVFNPSQQRRIILATNVAETSLTVPGIRYVIDSGLARVKRYSYRNKVANLQIEKISQAAANQRSGRCGRLANGVCIRLYSQEDFNARAKFTDPEILRSSLAAVILRMKALKLGEVEKFPFLQLPQHRAIVDGYQQLLELGAIDERKQLTNIGLALAKLPLEPSIARMLFEAHKRHALQEILIIASAISVPDVRDCPIDQQAKADQAHSKFNDLRSEFVSYIKLWNWLISSRNNNNAIESALTDVKNQEHSTIAKTSVTRLTNKQYETLLRENYLNPRRIREWRDVYKQLVEVVATQGWQINQQPASYEQLHLSLLSGLLSNIGCKSEQEGYYLGAFGVKFWPHPSSRLKKKAAKWIMAAQQVNTTKLYARCLANIEPKWLEQIGAHLLRKQSINPHWQRKVGKVIVLQRATLYGLVVFNNRQVAYEQLDQQDARNIFIRQALLENAIDIKLPFLQHNQQLIRQVELLEHKTRRQDILVDEEIIYAFYDKHLPADVCNSFQLETWYRQASKTNKKLLFLQSQDLKRQHDSELNQHNFPKYIRLGGIDCRVKYLHEPGSNKDGLTVELPVYIINQVSQQRCDWLVPGMLKEKIQALLKGLPQKIRAKLNPLNVIAEQIYLNLVEADNFAQQDLLISLTKWLQQHKNLLVNSAEFKTEMLPAYLFMNFLVLDEHGRQLGMGRNLVALKAQFHNQATGAFQQLASLKNIVKPAVVANSALITQQVQVNEPERLNFDVEKKYRKWEFGILPELLEIKHGKQSLIGYPALVSKGDAVSIAVFDDQQEAMQQHRQGLMKLFSLHLKDSIKYAEKRISDFNAMALSYATFGSADELKQQIIERSIQQAFMQEPLPQDEQQFNQRLTQGKAKFNLIVPEFSQQIDQILRLYQQLLAKLRDSKINQEIELDIKQQLQHLLDKKFIIKVNLVQLKHYPRYLNAIALRLDKAKTAKLRDIELLRKLQPYWQNYWRLVAQYKGVQDSAMLEFRWMLEEQRVSFFAQELRTPYPVSLKRLDKLWQQIKS